MCIYYLFTYEKHFIQWIINAISEDNLCFMKDHSVLEIFINKSLIYFIKYTYSYKLCTYLHSHLRNILFGELPICFYKIICINVYLFTYKKHFVRRGDSPIPFRE